MSTPTIKSPDVNFGSRLQAKRIQCGFPTQKDLADAIGVNKNSIQRYESTGEIPNGKILLKLSELFKCSVDWLLKGDTRSDLSSMGTENKEGYRAGNVIETEHSNIVKRFIDKNYAIELNLSLIELERLNPDAYHKVGSYIKGMVDGVRMMLNHRQSHHQTHREEGQKQEDDSESPIYRSTNHQ